MHHGLRGGWGMWTTCSKPCGGGTRSRIFSVQKKATAGGKACEAADNEKQTESCGEPVCAEACVGVWESTGTCQGPCGTPGRRRETYRVKKARKGSGAPCPHKNGDTRDVPCDRPPCPVDCEGVWEDSSACSANCGPGKKKQRFRVTKPRVGTGKACPSGTRDVPCKVKDCPQNCVAQYGGWSACGGGPCGGQGTRTRTLSVSRPASAGATRALRSRRPKPARCRSARWTAGVVGSVDRLRRGRCGQQGTQTRRYAVTTQPVGLGAACPTPQTQACMMPACPAIADFQKHPANIGAVYGCMTNPKVKCHGKINASACAEAAKRVGHDVFSWGPITWVSHGHAHVGGRTAERGSAHGR